MTKCVPSPPPKKENKHTICLLLAVSHINSVRIPSLTKSHPEMSVPLKVSKLNERPQTKYHNCHTLQRVKCLKNHVQNISKNHKKIKNH